MCLWICCWADLFRGGSHVQLLSDLGICSVTCTQCATTDLLSLKFTAQPNHLMNSCGYTHARRLGGCLFQSYHHTEETQQCLSVNVSYTEECDNNICSGSHGGVVTSHANLREKLTVIFFRVHMWSASVHGGSGHLKN